MSAAVRAELAALSAAGDGSTDVDELRRESEELRAAVEALREARGESQGSVHDALAQVEEIRKSFEERESALEAQFAEARAAFEERETALAFEVSEARRESAQMDTAVSAKLAAQVAEVRPLRGARAGAGRAGRRDPPRARGARRRGAGPRRGR